MSIVATVIIPTTGCRGALLALSVPTVLAQTVSAIEVFIVGDGVSDAARATIRALAADPRVRFFDAPKDARRGERRRHAILAEARGRIITYLCDRDLMLPNHIEVMDGLLRDADFGHTLNFGIAPDGGLYFHRELDITDAVGRAEHGPNVGPPLSFVGHTRAMYHRLPEGWRATPPDTFTDLYMWAQFLADPTCRARMSIEPTILYFKRGDHPGLPVAERARELALWTERMREPGWHASFREHVRDLAMADRSRFVSQLRRAVQRWAGRRFPHALSWLRQHRSADALAAWVVETASKKLRARKPEPPALTQAGRPNVLGLESIAVTPALRLEVCWINAALGSGPRASVYTFGDELMRLDCFASGNAHMHLNMTQTQMPSANGVPRLHFQPGDLNAYITRAAFELEYNLAFALATHRDRRVRALTAPPERLTQAANWMRERMERLASKHSGSSP